MKLFGRPLRKAPPQAAQSPQEAAAAIDWGVLATLGGLFVVGAGLGRSRLADAALARLDALPLSGPVIAGLLVEFFGFTEE